MSETAYTGLPGHGKSYGVVENVIVPALEQRRVVFTNIPMNSQECLKRFQMCVRQFDIQDIIDNPNWWSDVFEPGSVIVIDEVWRLWPAGLKANNVRAEDKSFLAEHRHMVGENGQSTEIVLVTQDLSQIASFARTLVETTFRVVKLSKIGMDSRYRVDVYFGPVTGASPPISKREREIHGKFRPENFALYRSHTKSVTGGAGNEKRVDGRFNVLGGASIKIGVAVAIIAFVSAFFGLRYVAQQYRLIQSNDVQNSVSTPLETQIIAKPTTPVAAVPREPIFKFLSLAESVSIVFNNGRFPRIDYRYRVVIDAHETILDDSQMSALEYELYPINQCMVKIKGGDFYGVALCEREGKQRGWIENIVTPNSM